MNLASLVPALYLLFTTYADCLAQRTGFIRRVRAFDGRTFLQTLVFAWLRRPNAPLEHLALALGISKQALQQRFTPAAVAFCKAALLHAVQQLFQVRPDTLACLRPFQGVFLDDCTQFWLPNEAQATFPACAPGRAGLKALLRWELQGGLLSHLGLHPARTGDRTALAQAPPLPKGCLHLADLAFTDFVRLQQESNDGIYWISRLPAQTHLFLSQPSRSRHQRRKGTEGVPLWRQLRQWRQQQRLLVEEQAWVGSDHVVQGRLVALACPPDIVARRLAGLNKHAKRLHRQVSERQRELCHWTVLWTNVPTDWLAGVQVWHVYRLRWQIELLIKRFKSEGGLRGSRSTTTESVEVEWYVKLLGQVVRNWLQLLAGGPLRRVNSQELGRVIADALGEVLQALREGVVALFDALWQLWQQLLQVRPRTRRRSGATASQRLSAPEWAAVAAPQQA